MGDHRLGRLARRALGQIRRFQRIDVVGDRIVYLICPLQSGPSTILVWTLKEKTNGQETRA
jgi:hypothetical protein